ncbi:MAG TPA: protein kinase, partial [Myxococcales bacterium]|nr:protein kinase [Myxococcales bacterium]
MGEVFLVQDTLEENQLQALKTIRREFVTSYGYSAFKNEFQAMTAFHHPNVVEVYEFGTVAGTQDDFFTMEYVEGKNLLAASKDADLETLYDYAVQIARALEYIHAQGFIHFDLKPDNIMVREDGTVKVMDFGLVEQSSI